MAFLPPPLNETLADATAKAAITVNPVRFEKAAALNQPLQDTLGRITGDPSASGPGQ